MWSPDGPGSRLRAGAPARYGSVTVLPVERVVVHARAVDGGAWIAATLEPVAVVVCDVRGMRAIAADATPLDLRGLIDEVPALEAALRSIRVRP